MLHYVITFSDVFDLGIHRSELDSLVTFEGRFCEPYIGWSGYSYQVKISPENLEKVRNLSYVQEVYLYKPDILTSHKFKPEEIGEFQIVLWPEFQSSDKIAEIIKGLKSRSATEIKVDSLIKFKGPYSIVLDLCNHEATCISAIEEQPKYQLNNSTHSTYSPICQKV